MISYEAYASYLEQLSAQALAGVVSVHAPEVAHALDGQPSAQLRTLSTLPERREAGAFFTGSALRARAVAQIADTLDDASVIFDSSMGVGDLLVAAAMCLPVAGSLAETLRQWGRQLRGVDLEQEFVRSTKARLLLLALNRCGIRLNEELPAMDSLFPQVGQGNGLDVPEDLAAATHITLNPSYAEMDVPAGCTWSTGKVNTASVFVEQSVRSAAVGTQIVAILPDVLRTGTRYERWRRLIEAHLRDVTIEVVGQFDAWTDVDVFILYGTVGRSSCPSTLHWWNADEFTAEHTVSDYFNVSVGPVVPHRHAFAGEAYPYITTATISGKTEFDADCAATRQFSGATCMPPFVALRRTSRPGQRGRAASTIITGTHRVTVENHLIVLTPHEISFERCQALQRVLNDRQTAKWLDQRIRCRHLTVGSIQELPWWP